MCRRHNQGYFFKSEKYTFDRGCEFHSLAFKREDILCSRFDLVTSIWTYPAQYGKVPDFSLAEEINAILLQFSMSHLLFLTACLTDPGRV